MKDRRYWLVAAAALVLTGTLLRADIISPLPFTFTNGQVIDASQFNSNFAAIVTGVNSNAATAGANSNITSLSGLTTAISPSLGGSSRFYAGAATGTVNDIIVAATTPNNFSLLPGYEVSFQATGANTGPVTLTVSSAVAKDITLSTGSGQVALTGAEIGVGVRTSVVFNGLTFQLLNPLSPPVGSIQDFAGATAPAGWLLTDGTSYVRATYPGLFAVIGTTYGSVDGTHFNVPDLRGRMTLMSDNSAGRITTATCLAPSTLGTGCGAQNYTVAQANLPSVNFTVSGTATAQVLSQSVFDVQSVTHTTSDVQVLKQGVSSLNMTNASSSVSGTAASGGSGTALAVLNPAMVLNKIIKY